MMHVDGGVPGYNEDVGYEVAELEKIIRDANYALAVTMGDVFSRSKWLIDSTAVVPSKAYADKTTILSPENGPKSYRVTNGDMTYVTYGPGSHFSAFVLPVTREDPDAYQVLTIRRINREDSGIGVEHVTAMYAVRSPEDLLDIVTIDQVRGLEAGTGDGLEAVSLLEWGSLWSSDAQRFDNDSAKERLQYGLKHSRLAANFLDELAQPVRELPAIIRFLWQLAFAAQQELPRGVN